MDVSYATKTCHKYILSSSLVGGFVTTLSPVKSFDHCTIICVKLRSSGMEG
uniref:Uncharacterized protein n=1 Tax=Musa acuminata subsp. malaccensis TaxID=214687 RepID=A0A804JM78_MUSAM